MAATVFCSVIQSYFPSLGDLVSTVTVLGFYVGLGTGHLLNQVTHQHPPCRPWLRGSLRMHRACQSECHITAGVHAALLGPHQPCFPADQVAWSGWQGWGAPTGLCCLLSTWCPVWVMAEG